MWIYPTEKYKEITQDEQLSSKEIDFLKENNTETFWREEFAEKFKLSSLLKECKDCKNVWQLGTKIQRNNETIALLQAYFFSDPNKINGTLSEPVFNKVKEYIEYREVDEKNYTLSEFDFFKYFEWENFQQQNIWDCWLVASVDSLVSWGPYKEYIKKSVTKTPTWFDIIMPLWAPQSAIDSWNAAVVSIDEQDLLPQKSLSWEDLVLVEWKDGIYALMMAYGKMATGKDTFDLINMATIDDNSWNPFAGLVWGINSYSEDRKDDRLAKGKFDRILSEFDSQTDMLTLGVNQLVEWYSKLEWYNKLWNWSGVNHDVSVERTYKENGILMVVVSAPQDSMRSYTISAEGLWKSCALYTMWSLKKKSYLWGVSRSEYWEREVSAFVKNSDQKNNVRNNEKSFSKAKTLNQMLQLTWKIDEDQRISRGDAVVQERNGDTYVDSRKRTDTCITYYADNITIISVGGQDLMLWDVFSDVYRDAKNPKYKSFLYPPRLTVFINKMRHDYIDKQNGDGKSPFSLDEDNWNLFFDDDFTEFSGGDFWERMAKNVVDDYVTVLDDRSLLWIKDSDIATKKKIIKFLNELYDAE